MWYYPYGGNYLPFIYYMITGTVVTSVFFVSLVRYLYTMRVIRKGVLSASELPTWVASSEGPVDRLFRSVFLLFLPMSTVAIAIVANRWVRQTGPLDFGMLWCVATIPIGIILLLIGPIVYSAIPHKMLQQRSEALRVVEEKILEALEELSHQSDEAEDQRLVDRLHALGAKKTLILKNYPTFPIGSITRIISAFPISLSALPALLSALAKLA
jgi:predicted membrane channel-forming protein YqfA (hemolysin III family)